MNIVIIPVHNQLPLLKKCLFSVLDKTPNVKIVLVNDASDKYTTKWIAESGFDFVHLKKNVGYSWACNAGLSYCLQYSSDIVCLLNSDTEVMTDDWFEKVRIQMNKFKNTAIAGVLSNEAGHQSVVCTPQTIDNFVGNVENVLIHGFCLFLKMDCMYKVGWFDVENFPHYGSEDDLCIRSAKARFKNIIVTNVYVKHHKSASYTPEQRLKILAKSCPKLSEIHTSKLVRSLCIRSAKCLDLLRIKIKRFEANWR